MLDDGIIEISESCHLNPLTIMIREEIVHVFEWMCNA
jgi:hypothetical protein